jgi:DNA-binding beta-propeller fold protein YncE
VTYSSQVVLPFGDNINHLSGLAVDTADNVYVLDHYYGQVWKQAPGASRLTTLAFKDIGQPVDVAVDNRGNLYVTDVLENRVLKLAPGVSSPTALPFTDLNQIAGVAVDTAGNVYVSDSGANRVAEVGAGHEQPHCAAVHRPQQTLRSGGRHGGRCLCPRRGQLPRTEAASAVMASPNVRGRYR